MTLAQLKHLPAGDTMTKTLRVNAAAAVITADDSSIIGSVDVETYKALSLFCRAALRYVNVDVPARPHVSCGWNATVADT